LTGSVLNDYAGYLARSAIRWPHRVGLRFEGSAWTYRQLQLAVESATAQLTDVGIERGARVLLLVENCPEYLIAQFALARLGAVFVTPNPYWTNVEIRHAVAASEATAAIYQSRFDEVAADLDIALPVGALLSSDSAAVSRHDAYTLADPQAPLYIPFSSGTTGMPKGVVHTRTSLCSGVEQLRHHTALTERDRLQLSLPLCHIFGATMSAAAVSVGAELTLFRRFDLDETLCHVRDSGVTIWPIAGAAAYRLAHRDDLSHDAFTALRYFMWGGSAVPAALATDISARTGVPFLCSYGMTEAMMVAFNPVARRGDWRLDSPGYATVGTELRVSDSGELLVRGPSVASGYTSATSDAFHEGWFATGDIASIDADGRLWITDRKKDMIKVSGFQVAPTEVENALMTHPDIVDAAVVGQPDPRTSEAAVAFVVGSDKLRAEALDAWLAGRLSTYKRPRRYVFVPELPRTVGGKIRRAVLREMTAETFNSASDSDPGNAFRC
jgi:long-chain acyl-CoA synthetase